MLAPSACFLWAFFFFFYVYSSQIILLCNTQYFLTEEKLCSLTFQFSCCYIWFFIIVNVFCLKTQNITLQVVGTIVFKTSSTLYIEKTWQYQEGTDPPLPPFVKGQTDWGMYIKWQEFNCCLSTLFYFSRISLSHLIPYHKHFVIWTQPQTEYSKQVQEQLLKTESPTYVAHLSLLHF